MITALLLLAACQGDPPTIDKVDPAEGLAGAELKILGSNFAEGTTATLGGQPLVEPAVLGLTLMQGKVPEGLQPGPQQLVVTAPDGQSATSSFTLSPPPVADVPCGGAYTAFTAIATDSGMVKIDKHYPGDESKREVVELPIRDIKAIEYEAQLLEDGELCSVIFIRMEDDRRHMFDDDTETLLLDRAKEIAVGLGKPIEVLREDTRPEAQ